VTETPTTPRLDVIAAVRDEQDNLREFCERLFALELQPAVELSVIFVEDSSRDATLERLRELAGESDRVRYYSIEHGRGQGPALVFSMAQSTADALVTMDADGSHPPESIAELWTAYTRGVDIAQAHRDPIDRRSCYRAAGSALFERLGSWLTGVRLSDQNVHFRLISASVRDRVLAHPAWWRFLRLLPEVGAQPMELIGFHAPPRKRGESKYGLLRLAGLAIDGVISLMPTARFGSMLAAIAVLCAALALGGYFGIAWVVALGGFALIAVRANLPKRGLLEQMRVRESSESEGIS
jgi:dolichol-phosphate mannosyltransferase